MIISISASEHLRQKKEEERNVIFLDIDGVLQPCESQERFKYDLTKTREKIANETGNNRYLQLDKYDVSAVYYDWSEGQHWGQTVRPAKGVQSDRWKSCQISC